MAVARALALALAAAAAQRLTTMASPFTVNVTFHTESFLPRRRSNTPVSRPSLRQTTEYRVLTEIVNPNQWGVTDSTKGDLCMDVCQNLSSLQLVEDFIS